VGRLPDEVPVGDARQIDPAGRGEAVPLPEPWVDLHQLELAVSCVALELDLGETEVAERCEQPKRRVHGVLHPDRLADTTRADAAGGLPELPA
jgi:hypothetical protein